MGNTALDGVVKHRDRLAERPVLTGLLSGRHFGTVLGRRGWEDVPFTLYHRMCVGVVLTALGI